MAKPQLIDNGVRTKGSTIRITRHQQKRLSTAVAMYMPSSVQVTYGAQYQDTQIGAVTEQALNTYNDFVAGRISDGVRGLKMGTNGRWTTNIFTWCSWCYT